MMNKLLIILIGIIVLAAFFTIAWYYYTNGYSFSKQYRIKSQYYENGQEYHIVQWKAFFHSHNYIVDAHYMEYADFGTKEEALKWFENMKKSNNCIREEIKEIAV